MSAVRIWFRTSIVVTLVVALATPAGAASYTVRPGETMSGIAHRLGVSVAELARVNGVTNPNRVLAGTVLTVPTSSGRSGGTVHTVRKGETLMGISIATGVKMNAIVAANGLRSADHIYAGQRLRIPAAATSAIQPVAAPAHRSADVGAILDRYARQYGFSPRFVKAIAWQESGWNNRARSSAGAIGIMQVLPSTGRFISTYLVGRPLNLRKATDNVHAGVAYLDYLWRLTDGRPGRTLAGYYQGLRSVRRHGYFRSTRRYIANVMALRDRF